jgi:GNAT superfamily N-acetyltransferase
MTHFSKNLNILWQSGNGMSLKAVTGEEAEKYFESIANLRINLYQDFPYLYKGNLEGERSYLHTYFTSQNSHVLLVFDHEKLVGFSNSIPLSEESDWLVKPFEKKGLDPKDFYYMSEVTLRPPYRGKGFLRKFFEYHEMQARLRGFSKIIFMSLKREPSHPLWPKYYRHLDPIWEHYGFQLIPDFDVVFLWNQIDTNKEETNRLNLWVKSV